MFAFIFSRAIRNFDGNIHYFNISIYTHYIDKLGRQRDIYEYIFCIIVKVKKMIGKSLYFFQRIFFAQSVIKLRRMLKLVYKI